MWPSAYLRTDMVYIITGTSSGIGKAIAERYLEKGEKVVGISRRNSINHPNFTFLPCDLTNLAELEGISLQKVIDPADFPICLINNAGMIGEIKRSYELSAKHYSDLAMINIVAVQFLCSTVLKTFKHENVDAIINITSGAAQRPVPSWSAYCASKAAIDLFGQTLQEEIKELGYSARVFNVAPGVVDTEMQVTIRESGKDNFSGHQRFVDLKNNQELRSPKEVALLLEAFIDSHENQAENVVFRL